MRMVITDLDNTLYDWVTFFAHAFQGMSRHLAVMLGADEETVLDEFRALHRRYGNSELPFGAVELPSVRHRFGASSRATLCRKLEPALHEFFAAERRYLKLYPTVAPTLERLHEAGIFLVAHTEAIAVTAYDRLVTLNVVQHFRRLYTLEGHGLPPSDPLRQVPPASLVREVSVHDRKPNPRMLLDICREEGVDPRDACYVGDSLTRDICMARAAGMTAVWARYGTAYDRSLWDVLVRVTHWTDEDVARETAPSHIEPDLTIDAFEEILQLTP